MKDQHDTQMYMSNNLDVFVEEVVSLTKNSCCKKCNRSNKVSPEFLKIAESVGTKYAAAFKELAK